MFKETGIDDRGNPTSEIRIIDEKVAKDALSCLQASAEKEGCPLPTNQDFNRLRKQEYLA